LKMITTVVTKHSVETANGYGIIQFNSPGDSTLQ